MINFTISNTYSLKWQINENYYITKCSKVINLKRGIILKKCLNGGVIGYWINKKFVSLDQLNEISKPIKINCPF